MENFIKIFCDKYSIKEEDAQILVNNMTEKKYFKNDIIIKQEQVNNSVFIIKEGIARGVRFVKQKESTICIITEGQAFCSAEGFLKENPAAISIQALTNCIVYSMNKQEIDSFAKKYPIFYDISINVLEEIIFDLTNLQVIFIDYPNAIDRYKLFLSIMPKAYNRIPLKYIASQLNITPQSLSRLKKSI